MGPAAPRLVGVRNFVVYYGYGPLPGLQAFDLALLEPAGWRADDLADLATGGVRTLAYLSGMEASETLMRAAGLRSVDLLHVDGRPWFKPEFETWVVDPRSVRWQAFLRARVTELVAAGWSGVFVDTVGAIEDERLTGRGGALLPAVAEVVELVRTGLGDRLLVQNSGLSLLLPLVAPLLDGVCWEGYPSPLERPAPWLTQIAESLTGLTGAHGLAVLLLRSVDEGAGANEQVAALADLARRRGFLAYTAPGAYTTGVRLPDGRIVAGRPTPG